MTWLTPEFDFLPDDSSIVRLMHHDARWKQEFEQTRSGIFQSCEGRVIQVEHVGSTAISGLIARPIIDVVAVTDRNDGATISAAQRSIEGLNFRAVDPPLWSLFSGQQSPGVWLQKPRHGEPTHCILLVTPEHPWINRMVRVRDYLRENPEHAIRYEESKVAHWKKSNGDVESYLRFKSLYFSHLEDQAD